ncbi:NADPH-dependent 7-cyano-7-deazaguanine reductase QueF [Stenotrophomonas sp. SY1]|jgi:7-cyano-7-deazaguanine reductase|uniref:NADPH-dependent 7-cyano-7-deazaguanine reductase QueF n=1 Tax=Stenotrophomonas sp. SY1 TaxID=477235 RepID=UPI001E4EA791|nr:NADPH-dependent 7-cyano-7-deazaguanine reductase QueF [Stenotrophomonas sp. SY1]MCD9085618.1 NADPH-dependent 7-cyano-7-deazaguanine reductase QueF [Stenotrophomonas sp. SY1]
MNTPQDSSLGREVDYPRQYDASLLFPIPRAGARSEIGLDGTDMPFLGEDRWHAYELGWLDARGKPCVETLTLWVPATSPNLIESKSLKLYLNSLNNARFNRAEAVRERIATDLSACAGADVRVEFGLPAFAQAQGETVDHLDVDIDCYGPPNAAFLSADDSQIVDETLTSALLKSNCPVTGQPDWASVSIQYQGPRIDREGLLRYLVSYRDHAEFHEQCVERIFLEVMRRCGSTSLEVEARYTRRGGLDINPRRATPDRATGNSPIRDLRQ